MTGKTRQKQSKAKQNNTKQNTFTLKDVQKFLKECAFFTFTLQKFFMR